MENIDIKSAISCKKLVDKNGLEGAIQLIIDMFPYKKDGDICDKAQSRMKRMFQEIYNIEVK